MSLKSKLLAACLMGGMAVWAGTADAGSRYGTPPPLTLSPDLASPWTLQLGSRSVTARKLRRAARRASAKRKRSGRVATASVGRAARTQRGHASGSRSASTLATASLRPAQETSSRIDMLPATVTWNGSERAGTVIVNTIERKLYLVQPGGTARRYAIGVGKPGFEWAGTHRVSRKAEWPSWTPPKEMIARERKKGRELPAFMPGGPENPMGARALYLGSTIYRIHGTNQAWSIGKAVSSGCIRMLNQDVMDLYERVPVGAKVKVI